MAATTILASNNAKTFLAASITAAATTAALSPGTGSLFPNPGANQAFPITFVDALTGLVNEVVKVTAMSGDTIVSMVRGQEGTSPRSWLAGDLVNNFMTAGALGFGALAQSAVQQSGQYNYAVDTGSANAIVIALSPAITTYTDGMPLVFKAAANNTGATTINAGAGAIALQGDVGALQGGEIVAGKIYVAYYNSTGGVALLAAQTGGAQQVSTATQSEHAVPLAQAQGGLYNYAVATGTANAVVVALTPALTAYVDGFALRCKIAATNTGAATINVNGLGTRPIVGLAQAALQGGELFAGGYADFEYSSSLSSFILKSCSGGAVQTSPATQSQHAVQLGQVAGVVGSVRNLAGSLTAAATSISLTADEIIVESALGGLRYCLPSFNKTLTITGTGAGGMDTGSAPASGWLGIYAIYNPTTATSALLGVNGSGVKLPSVYGGANMPSGYTASALLTVLPTNASSQIGAVRVYDRRVDLILSQILNTLTQAPTPTLLNSGLTQNAHRVKIIVSIVASATATLTYLFSGNAQMLGESEFATTGTAGGNFFTVTEINLDASPSMYYQATVSAGTIGFNAWLTSYEI